MSFHDSTTDFMSLLATQTEHLLSNAIRSIDRNGGCEVVPSFDIGFPHEVLRLAAGFPTGVYVRWECKDPFVPIDTTVNVCTSSTYHLVEATLDRLHSTISQITFLDLENNLKRSSYTQNFHKGNHFVSFTRSESNQGIYLVLHSSASEFKQTYNGTSPTPGNWYSDEIKVFHENNRVIRYITGTPAERFYRLAKFAEPFNETRHDFFAEMLSRHLGSISEVTHDHHYLMPDENSVLIGSFLLEPMRKFPIFTAPGDPLLVAKSASEK